MTAPLAVTTIGASLDKRNHERPSDWATWPAGGDRCFIVNLSRGYAELAGPECET